uniref:Thioredoxin-like_fold domain-containing protein n=1 Tax=Caenorhabditis tropicalis TaxID=1561998 RepID=A0A1I7ULK9_9PELO
MILHIFLVFLPHVSTLFPLQLCSSPPSITFRGSNDITRTGGTPSLIVFAPLQCANCYNYLRKLNYLAASGSYRISVVAPDFESNHIIQRTSTAFPNIQIDRAGEGWPRFGVKNFDAIVLDSCSRITETFQWPQSDVTSSSTLQAAMDASSIKCASSQNSCQMVQGSSRKRVNAYIQEQEAEQLRRNQMAQTRQAPVPTHPPNHHQSHLQNAPGLQNTYYHYQNQKQNHQNPYHHQNPHQNFYTPPAPPVTTERTTTTTTTTASSIDYDYYPESDDVIGTTQTTQFIMRNNSSVDTFLISSFAAEIWFYFGTPPSSQFSANPIT